MGQMSNFLDVLIGALPFFLIDLAVNRKIKRSRFSEDVFYLIFNAFVTKAIGGAVVTWMVIKLNAALNVQFLASSPLIVRAGVALLAMDLLQYWNHRILHNTKLWPIHAIHHQPEEIDWLTATRLHPLNYLSGYSRLFILAFIPVPLGVAYGLLLAPVIYAFFVHINLRINFGPLEYIFISPSAHRWHHSADGKQSRRNFGVIFSVWDVLFGTFHNTHGATPERYGIDDMRFDGILNQLKLNSKAKKLSQNETSSQVSA
jgi:sterol desaturase/sphingolipid hydroxylase (fatty acid hydroxylase superfamily)